MVNLVRIDGIGYTVCQKENVISDNEILWGQINYSPATISVQENLAKDVKYQVLMHEVMHGISTSRELNLDENVVLHLGKAVYAFMKDNPKLLLEVLDISKKEFLDKKQEFDLGEPVICSDKKNTAKPGEEIVVIHK